MAALTDEMLRAVKGELDAQAVYREVKRSGDFAGFARRFMHSDDGRVARNAFWVLTKASDQELSQLQGMLNGPGAQDGTLGCAQAVTQYH